MTKNRIEGHFDNIAKNYDSGKKKYSFYYSNLKKLLSSLTARNKNIFEVGCGTGDLLASLSPNFGYGMDLSSQMIRIAKTKYSNRKQLYFSTKWPNIFTPLGGTYDYIFMSDVVEHLDNPRDIFRKIKTLMKKDTLFINTMANPKWEWLLMFWERMGWKMKEGPHERYTHSELKIILGNLGLKIVDHDYTLLLPVNIPVISSFANRYLLNMFKKYAFLEYFVVSKK